MMDFLADSWVLWMIIWMLFAVGLVFYRQSNRSRMTTFTSAEDFSVRTIFFSLKKGEADLFIGIIVAMVAFSLFVLGFTRFIRTVLG